jgi:hypothetical protein
VDSAGNIVDRGGFGGSWVSFGEDINDELFVVDISGNIFRIIDATIAGVDDSEANSFQLIPNPATDTVSLSLEFGNIQNIQIADITGAVVYSEENIDAQNHQLSISALRSGIYLVSVETDSGTQRVEKLVVQ